MDGTAMVSPTMVKAKPRSACECGFTEQSKNPHWCANGINWEKAPALAGGRARWGHAVAELWGHSKSAEHARASSSARW